MDSAIRSNRQFPAHTTKELQAALLTVTAPDLRQRIEAEIEARLSGKSVALKIPQLIK